MLIINLSNQSSDENSQNNQALRIKYLNEAYQIVNLPGNHDGWSYGSLMAYYLLSAYSENDSLSKAQEIFNIIQKEYATLKPMPFEYKYKNSLIDYHYLKGEYNKALNPTWSSRAQNKKKTTYFSG